MTLNITDFNGEPEPKLTLGDFNNVTPEGVQIARETAATLAATQSIVAHGSADEFRATREMLLDPKSRGNFATEQTAIRQRMFDGAAADIINLTSNSSLTLDERIQLVEGAQAVFPSPFGSTPALDTLAEESLIAPSGLYEGEESAEMRYNFADSIKEVNSRKRNIANAINLLAAENSPTVGSMAVDMAEMFAPLAEWVHTSRLLSAAEADVGSDEGVITLLGEQKAQLYDVLKNLPSSEREAFSYAMIELVKAHENVLLPDGNDLVTMQTLERMLLDGDYSDFERWFDNATSVLDVLFVGGVVRSAGRSVRGAARAARGGTRGSSTITDAEIVSGQRTPTGTAVSTEAGITGEIVEETGVVLRDVNPSSEPGVLDLDPSQWSSAVDVPRLARTEATHTSVNPASPSQVVKDTNPEMARDMHRIADEDTTGEAAEALYGTTRQEALAKDLLPEPEKIAGRTPNKVEMNSRPVFEEPPEVRASRLREGNIAVSPQEMSRVFKSIQDRLKLQVSNMVVKSDPSGVMSITARYNPQDAGFRNYDAAINEAEHAFQNYGMVEDNFSIFARTGDTWREVSRADAAKLPEGTVYSVGVKWDYRLRPEDLEEVDLLTTGNFFTRIMDRPEAGMFSPARSGQGSFVQNLLDASSTVHKQLVGAASVAVDRAFGMEKLYISTLKGFTDTYAKMGKSRRAAVTNYINEANFEGIRFSTTDLASRGFSAAEIDAIRVWREANDILWHATNADLVKTLRGKGYVAFSHRGSDTKLIGRPAAAGGVSSREVMFDAAQGKAFKLSRKEIDELYESGGGIIKLDEPIEIDGRWVDHVINRNNPQSGYTRQLYDGETVLAYRDGYYPVAYDANYFIYRTVNKGDGTEANKVIGTAQSRKEAEAAIARMQGADSKAKFDFRKDRRLDAQRQQVGEEGWNLVVNSGTSAQRLRGKKLDDLSAGMHKDSSSNLIDPLEAMRRQIGQLSARAPMRQVLDTMKKRWMLNYGKHLDLPVNKITGKPEFPDSITAIKNLNQNKAGFTADARTNFNYIYGLENGYINGMDELYRGVLHLAGDLLSTVGKGKIEGALLNSTGMSPVQASKTAAFKLFLSLNPLRQAVVQRGQMLMLGAIEPQYLVTGLMPDLLNISKARAGLKVDPKTTALLREVEESGILEAVDAHNFVRSELGRLADVSASQRAKTAVAAPVNYLQKIGFDLAEQDNLLSAWLTFRQKAIREGADLTTQRGKDQVIADARAYTLNMNRAGEQPYSQNTLGLMAQFMSFTHKAFLQPFTNKSLTNLQRAQLLAYTTAMFGVSATAMAPVFDWMLGGDAPSEMKDNLRNGMLDVALNTAASIATGTKQAVDWGDLAPVEAYGIGNTLVGMFSTNLNDMIANSPAGSLVYGANPRIANIFKTGARYFSVIDDYEDPELDTKLSDVGIAFLNLASGYSNTFKARYAYRMRQKMSASGRVTDSDITGFESVMANFGFQTRTETGYRAVNEVIYGTSSFEPDDVQRWYSDLRGQLARRGQSVEEIDLVQRIASEAWRVFGEDRPKAAAEIVRLLERDAADGDFRMFQGILRAMGLRSEEEVWEMINAMPNNVYRDRATTLMQGLDE